MEDNVKGKNHRDTRCDSTLLRALSKLTASIISTSLPRISVNVVEMLTSGRVLTVKEERVLKVIGVLLYRHNQLAVSKRPKPATKTKSKSSGKRGKVLRLVRPTGTKR